ncbi:type II toxin-antitoxin system YafQ family toxin [Neisseria elongata]|jgi:mRNA interferase YafQ|uniref:type II toxin-antitoxin system YafQ family toxin n=1 Tax=Neisseria elongata TaxID=495 RepID=UPI000D315CC6|nr:type II toxin-antitoxin system YafQ family toxin [Neisseria elongata]
MSRRITLSNKFKRDVAKQIQKTLTTEWIEVINCLMNDLPLPEKYCDHQLKGDLKDCRDCHVENDLVLLYSKYDDEKGNPILQLVRLGSHSELFG